MFLGEEGETINTFKLDLGKHFWGCGWKCSYNMVWEPNIYN